MELRSQNLILRYPGPDDAPRLLELADDPDVTKWFSWGPYTSLEQPLAYVDRLPGQRERGEQVDLLVVHREDGPIGITGLSEFSPRDRRCVVGTWFGKPWWGSGANRESKAAMAHLAFAVLGMHRLGSYSNPANERSTKALLGVGFRHEGVLRGYHRHDGRHLDVNVFGMLREDWESGPLRDVPVEVSGEPPPALRPT